MIDVGDIKFLLAIYENGTLVAAARQLKVTPSAVTQQLQQIEKRLDTRLVDRSARRLFLTEEGKLLCQRGKPLIEQYDALMHDLFQHRSSLIGTLRINAPFGFGRRYLASVVAQFQAQHPEVEIALTLSDQPMLEAHDRFDVVIHIGQLRASNLIAYTIAANSRFICASPDFIAQHGLPRTPEDLAHIPCITLQENNEDATLWHFKKGRTSTSVRVHSTLTSNDGDVIGQWAAQGLGIILRSEWDVAQDLRDGTLVHLLPEWKMPEANVIALTHQREGLPLRIRQFMSFLKEQFAPQPPWRV